MKKLLLLGLVLMPLKAFADDWQQTQALQQIANELHQANNPPNNYWNSPLAAEQQNERFQLKLIQLEVDAKNQETQTQSESGSKQDLAAIIAKYK